MNENPTNPSTPGTRSADVTAPSAAKPPLGPVLWPLVYCGWGIGMVRLGLDAFAPDLAMLVGLYYLLPLVLIVFVVQGRFRDLGLGRVLLVALIAAPLISFPVNSLAYGAAQFAEWTHGRFAPERAPEIVDGVGLKIVWALGAGLGTSVAGTIWLTGWTLLVVGVPRLVRRLTGRG